MLIPPSTRLSIICDIIMRSCKYFPLPPSFHLYFSAMFSTFSRFPTALHRFSLHFLRSGVVTLIPASRPRGMKSKKVPPRWYYCNKKAAWQMIPPWWYYIIADVCMIPPVPCLTQTEYFYMHVWIKRLKMENKGWMFSSTALVILLWYEMAADET